MTNLRTAIDNLLVLSGSYATRARRNGPGHPHNAYLEAQAGHFAAAANAISAACIAAAYQATGTHPTPAFEVIAAFDFVDDGV